MIVDTAYITDLALGTDRRIPQEGDNQLIIPATVLPVLPLISPNQFNPGAVIVNDSSFTEDTTFIHTNTAATITRIARLAKGLWRIRFNGYFVCNFVGDVAGADETSVRIKDTPTGVLNNLYTFYPSLGTGNSITQLHSHEDVFLFFNETEIEVRRPTTGVGETIIVGTAIRASKIL